MSNASFGEHGRRFGDYEMVRQLGRGGMGVVYEAIQLRARRRVAVKMILDAQVSSLAARRRFAIEAEAAAKLDHPNIVPIYEVGEHDEQPFLSMKLVEGESLSRQIAIGQFCVARTNVQTNASALRRGETVVARLMATIARAVHHAHQKGVLHRDLKPGNILIDGEGNPHLTDFGLAKIFELDSEGVPGTQTHTSAIQGTPCYMSPEQASNQRLTTASDVYSLGAMFYEMLTGRPPFKGTTLVETIRMVTELEPRHPRTIVRGLSADLDTICLKCLEKNPDARYSSALALAEDLERWLEQEPIQARPASPALRVRRWVSRNPVGASLIVSLCACLAVSLLFLRTSVENERRNRITRENSLAEFITEVDRLWENQNRNDVLITSSELAELRGRPPREVLPDGIRLTFARTISKDPVAQAIQTAPLLAALEAQMTEYLGRQVRFDLRLSKDRSWATPAVLRRDADIQSMSQLAYVRLKGLSPDLQPIVFWGNNDPEAVIFTRADLKLGGLGEVAGRSVLFAHTNSIVSFMAKVHLVRTGICATNLKSYCNLERSTQRTAPSGPNDTPVVPAGDTENEDYAHREVLDKVASGKFDVGVAPRRRFEQARSRGIKVVELGSYPVPRDVVVMRAEVGIEVIAAFQKSLTTARGGSYIARQIGSGRMRRTPSEIDEGGFKSAADSDFNEIRAALTNELVCFDNVPPSPDLDPSPSQSAAR
jgi:serine/threonine protein kinase